MSSNYKLSGLVGSVLPNVYINKVTLEGSDQSLKKASTNRESVIEMHIDKRTSEQSGGWQGNPDPVNQEVLTVTYDIILEFGDTNSLFNTGFLSKLNNPQTGFFEHLNIGVLTLAGNKGKHAYDSFVHKKPINQSGTSLRVQKVFDEFWTSPGGGDNVELSDLVSSGLMIHKDYVLTGRNVWSSEMWSNPILQNEGQTDPKDQKKLLDHTMSKYRVQMPNGTMIYKIPIRLTTELNSSVYPSHLSAIAVCSLNMDSFDISGKLAEIANQNPNDDWSDKSKALNTLAVETIKATATLAYELNSRHYGRIAPELIISSGKIVDKGMIFYVAHDQGTTAANKKWEKIKGTIWLGGVHKHKQQFGAAGSPYLNKVRYMAGNEHVSGGGSKYKQPFLDYVLVENRRVSDFRQYAMLKKQLLDFTPLSNQIFGGDYYNLQSKVATADFGEIACFSNLISSIERQKWDDPKVSIKLFFTVDWGKILKRYSMVPKIIDTYGDAFFGTLPKFHKQLLSFKVKRKRLNVPNNTINQNNTKLIYDNYPKIYYFG